MATKKIKEYLLTYGVRFGNGNTIEHCTVYYSPSQDLSGLELVEDIKRSITAHAKEYIISKSDVIKRVWVTFMQPLCILLLCTVALQAQSLSFQSIQSFTLEDETTCNRYTVSYIGNCLTIAPSRCVSNIFLDISSKKIHATKSSLGQQISFQNKDYTVSLLYNTKIEKVQITSNKLNLVLI